MNNKDKNITINCKVDDDDVFIYSGDGYMTGNEVSAFINQNDSLSTKHYSSNYQYYKGNQDILKKDTNILSNRPDNRVVDNDAKYIVDTYNGYFIGKTPKIMLNSDNNNDDDNNKLQDWLNYSNFISKLSETSKYVDIYGRSYIMLYQNEDGKTNIANIRPDRGFTVYDDSVNPNIYAFVMYYIDNKGNYNATIYYNDVIQHYVNGAITNIQDVNIYGIVPVVEFYEGTDRQGAFDSVKNLIDKKNDALSQKANQVEYFDNAYLVVLGVDMQQKDKDGNVMPVMLQKGQVLNAPNVDATKAKIEFLSKPDGDNIQENLLNRYVDEIAKVSQVPNLKDQDFGNSSGTALRFKLLPMMNKAANKEHSFNHAITAIFKILFNIDTVLTGKKDSWQDLNIQFYRNMPVDITSEADVAQKLNGIVSKESLLSQLTFIDDPQKEIERIDNEKENDSKGLLNLNDIYKDNNDDKDNQ